MNLICLFKHNYKPLNLSGYDGFLEVFELNYCTRCRNVQVLKRSLMKQEQIESAVEAANKRSNALRLLVPEDEVGKAVREAQEDEMA